MPQIGRRIYYDLATGNTIYDSGERQGAVIPTTVDDDFAKFPQLNGYTQSQVGYVELDFGAQAEQFAAGFVSHVDPTTQALTFTPFPPPPTPAP